MKKFLLPLFIIISFTLSLQAESLRIELKELSNNISKYKIIDVRDKDLYELSHLPNALNLPATATYNNSQIDGKITQPMKMQSILQNLGFNIKVYDNGTIFDASRVFWTLEVYGFENVKLLNGGFAQWDGLNLPLTSTIPTVKKSDYIATINNKRLATKFTTQIATRNPNQVIVDARRYNSYIGKESLANRFGHIPKAIHIPAIHNLNDKDASTVLKSPKELKKLYEGIDKTKKVVIYCTAGKVASTNYFALRELGYNVANYDASWKEWGNDFNLPIVNKSQK